MSWGAIFAGLALKYGWTFDQIADMTLDQIVIAWHDGKPRSRGVPIRSEAEVLAMHQARRGMFYAFG